MQGIKNIILDLGGIFLNVDYTLTEKAFVALGVTNFNEFYSQHNANHLFEQFETGKISPDNFCEELRKISKTNLSNQQIFTAWNAMLLDFPKERIDWLEKLSKQYKVFLYSNTNKVHYDSFIETANKVSPQKYFNDYFVKAYYSHEMGMRKPYKESFEKILAEQNLVAEETLFIDDTSINIEGAKLANLKTLHLVSPQTVLDLDL